MAKRALIIRHAEPETLAANYKSALVERGFELRALNVFEGAPGFEHFDAPPLDEVDLIIVLGGPSVGQRLATRHCARNGSSWQTPWLRACRSSVCAWAPS